MTGLRRVSTAAVILIAGTTAGARAAANLGGRQARRPPPAAAADCGPGVPGIGFTAYPCMSGAGDTTYAHPAELLVVRSNGSYTNYRDTISEPNLMARSARGEVFAAHDGAIVRVTASKLTALVGNRQIMQLLPPHVASSVLPATINSLSVNASGSVVLVANYYASDRHGCGNLKAELTAAGRLTLLWRSGTGAICG